MIEAVETAAGQHDRPPIPPGVQPERLVRVQNKVPRDRDWPNLVLDLEDIAAWPGDFGVKCGAVAEDRYLLVVDVDVKNGQPGLDSLARLDLPPTYTTKTPSGGQHLYFYVTEPPPTVNHEHWPGIDIKGQGGQAVVYPPLHPHPIATLARLPEQFNGHRKEAALGPGATAGGRNSYLARRAGMLWSATALSPAELSAALLRMNQDRCVPPLPEDEVTRIASSIARYPGAPKPASEQSSELSPDPVPLPAELPPVQPFTQDLLPPVLADWAMDVAERMQCPADFPAVGMLVMCASLVGRQVSIRPKARDNWLVVPNLWGVVIGRPGVMKTPALREALRAVYALETGARDRHAEAATAYEVAATETKHRRRVAEESFRKALKKDSGARLEAVDGPELPVRRRYLVADATVEKLGELLNQNPNGLLLVRDELSGFLRNLDRQGREADRAFYLECWNGDGSFTYDRIGRGTVDIESCCLSIIGSIQPGPFLAYVRGARGNGGLDDGLLQRFQLAVWPDDPGRFKDVDRAPDDAIHRATREVVRNLANLNTADLTKGPEGPYVAFDSEGLRHFQKWRSDLENRLRQDDEHPALESHLAKYRSLVPGLALVFHLLGSTPPRALVGTAAVQQAIAFAKYLESHARRIYAPVMHGPIDGARLLLRHLKRGGLGQEFAARDVYRKGWAGLSDPESVKAAIQVLEEFDWVFARNETTPGRTRLIYRVNTQIRLGAAPT